MSLTVIIPNLNNGENIIRTINGVLKNSRYIECVIIVDGYSKDGSFENLKEALSRNDDFRCIFIQERPNGIFSAIRSGVKMVKTSHFLVNLGGDELINIPDLNLSLNTLYYGTTQVIDFNKVIFSFSDPNPSLYKMPHINMNSIIWPTLHFKNSNYFNNNLKVASDFAMLHYFYKNNFEFKFQPEINAKFYKDGLSSSVEMLYFGIGECLYVCWSARNFIRPALYAALKSLQSPSNLIHLMNGFNFARKHLNDF